MSRARVVFATTVQSSDALYLTRAHVPDAYVMMDLDGERIGVFNAMEQNRMRTQSAMNTVLPLEEYYDKAKAAFGVALPGPGDILAILARERRLVTVEAGSDFPALVLRQAERRGLLFDVADGPLFPERQFKSDAEADEIRKGNAAASAGFAAVERLLAESTVAGDGKLIHDGVALTSERVKTEIEIACIKMGTWALETILAGGQQACDPHCEGFGPLHANELIVADIFPRLETSGYHGDMSRTYLKGAPSDEQKKFVSTVAEGQKLAFPMIRDGADGRAIHMAVTEFFASKGYPTTIRNGRNVGFFHGLGHGLGLDVHEAPRMNRSGSPLAAGMVVTVEPGLYFPGLGGCRIEDVVRVTNDGVEMLSSHPCEWVIQ